MKTSSIRLAVCAGVLALSGGCKEAVAPPPGPPPPIVPVKGTVKLDGQPAKGLTVRFVPESKIPGDYIATGTTDEQGNFELECKGKPGACEGKNKVLIVEPELPDELLGEGAQDKLEEYKKNLGRAMVPSGFANLAQTPLEATVSSEKTEYNFELTSKKSE